MPIIFIRFLLLHKHRAPRSQEEEGDEPPTTLYGENLSTSHFEFLTSAEATEALSIEVKAALEEKGLQFRTKHTAGSLEEVEQKQMDAV